MFTIQDYPIDNLDYVDIVLPVDCDGFGLSSESGAAFTIRTAPGGYERQVLSGSYLGPTAPINYGNSNSLCPRHCAGHRLVQAKASIASDKLIGEFV